MKKCKWKLSKNKTPNIYSGSTNYCLHPLEISIDYIVVLQVQFLGIGTTPRVIIKKYVIIVRTKEIPKWAPTLLFIAEGCRNTFLHDVHHFLQSWHRLSMRKCGHVNGWDGSIPIHRHGLVPIHKITLWIVFNALCCGDLLLASCFSSCLYCKKLVSGPTGWIDGGMALISSTWGDRQRIVCDWSYEDWNRL